MWWWWLAVACGAIIATSAFYGAVWAAWRWRLTRVDVYPDAWPLALDGLTILHLSDLHCRRRPRVEHGLVRLAARGPVADLVLITGDLAEGDGPIESCVAALGSFRSRYGAYAVLGNNDWHARAAYEQLARALAAASIVLLEDRLETLALPGGQVCVAGLTYRSLKRQPDGYIVPVVELTKAAAGRPLLLLAHTPDVIVEAAASGVPLLLSGHTHGGQVCLPGGYALHNNLHRFAPPAYARGVFRLRETMMVVSAGLGMTHPSLRLNCPPEAVWITVRATRPDSDS